MTPLGTAFGRFDALKRRLYDLIQNPSLAAQQALGGIAQSAQEAQALQNQAFGNPQRPLQVTDEQALARLTGMIMGGPLGFAPAGITAFHGSPYLFRQFDPAKVGAGEGAQAYGVGAGYTAEARPVAEAYAQANRGRAAALSGEIDKLPKPAQMEVFKALNRPEGFIKQAEILDITKRYPETTPIFESSKSYLYKGDIPDQILPKFLDWDKPLFEQSKEVKEALAKLPHRSSNWTFKDTIESLEAAPHLRTEPGMNPTGQEIYNMLGSSIMTGNRASGQLEATQKLNDLGIRGIRYLDQGSRGKGKGTSNFIPFRPEDYKVQEINDIPIEDWISKGLLGP
jgi:hypothetical protein